MGEPAASYSSLAAAKAQAGECQDPAWSPSTAKANSSPCFIQQYRIRLQAL